MTARRDYRRLMKEIKEILVLGLWNQFMEDKLSSQLTAGELAAIPFNARMAYLNNSKFRMLVDLQSSAIMQAILNHDEHLADNPERGGREGGTLCRRPADEL